MVNSGSINQYRTMSAKEKYYQFEPSSEDTVQCLIFTLSLESDSEAWENLSEKINSTIASLTEGYIWHRDNFKVNVPVLDEDVPCHLSSSTCFGDNIEDEWFIVHIILELTRQYPNIIVQISDNDGDFLMIEAADYLPSWANPDTTENRVFIYNNHIHIIPPNLASTDGNIKILDALQCITQYPEQTKASPEIENAIINRIGNYPDKHIENIHNAIVELPLEIAALLKLEPNVIAHIVNTYCHHDDIDIKACKTLQFDDTVTVSVKFTKCLYAMLLHSKTIKHIISPTEKVKSTILGKKIACGFNMIMNRSSDVFSSKEFHKFLKSLTDNGYFKNNIEGSQEYKKLLDKSKTFFLSVECPISTHIANNVSEIMKSEKYIKYKEELKKSQTSNLVEDSEEWLNVHPEQLNNLLNSRYGKTSKFVKNDIITPQNISSELTEFLKKSSDYEGIETDKEDQSNEHVQFDPDQFVNCLEKMFKLLSTNTEELDSDLDDAISGSDDEISKELDLELSTKLQGMNENMKDNKSILENIISSMREEQASSGPSSNLMTTLGLNKTDFLDSDDD